MRPPDKSPLKVSPPPLVEESVPEPVEKPEQYARVRLYFKDAPEMRGVWTGIKWWADRHEVFPVRWESEAAVKALAKKK